MSVKQDIAGHGGPAARIDAAKSAASSALPSVLGTIFSTLTDVGVSSWNPAPDTKRRLKLRIVIVDELPQWITRGDQAAYTPFTRTIWITRQAPWSMLMSLLHELGHHVIEIVSGAPWLHEAYDALQRRF